MQTLEPGHSFGKYRIVSELGRGGMGIVYRAVDTSLGREVALKVLPISLTSENEDFLSFFQHEAMAIAQLAHPNIVHVHAFDLIDDIPTIEMEYIEGGSLFEKFGNADVSTSDIVRYVWGITRALSYCHASGMVHRDIKPSNILVDNHNQPRVADFGLAKILAKSGEQSLRISASTVFKGTPQYAPPEAWDGEQPSVAWDIYSLGAVTYEALTGTPPYEAKTPLELIKKISTMDVPSVKEYNAGVSVALSDLIREMMHQDAAQRPKDADEVRARLEDTPEFKAMGGQESQISPEAKPSVDSSVPPPKKTGMPTIYKALLVIIFGIGPLLVTLWYTTGSEPADDVDFGGFRGLQDPSVALTRIPATNEITPLRASDASVPRGRLFRARFQGNNVSRIEDWYLELDENDVSKAITSYGVAQLARLELNPSESDGEYRVVGHWAGYQDKNATVLRYGSVTGTLHVPEDSSGALGALTYVADQDGAKVDGAIWTEPPGGHQTRDAFVTDFEASPYLQSLLFTELIPRGLEWAEEIERLLPSFNREVVAVPVIRESLVGTFVLDGKLDDDVWFADRDVDAELSGVLRGKPDQAEAILRLVATPGGVLIGLECAIDATEPLLLELRFQRDFPVPLSAYTTFRVVYDEGKEETREQASVNASALREGGARVVSRMAQGRWYAEGLLPFDEAYKNFIEGPVEARRWRMNVCLKTLDPDSPCIVRWGYEDESALEHGAILRFGAN